MTKPVWGNPWHGPVLRVGSQFILTLPNGQTMVYPTSVTSSRRTGDTYLVKVPGVADVVRTPEEAADDIARGRQWWNQAILSSQTFHLYGKALNGWIYCDPAGARWRVTGLNNVGISSNSGSWSVTLTRFGEFQGEPQAFSYTVSLGDLGQAGPALSNLASLQFQVRDLKPDGSGALVAIVATRGISSESGLWPEFSSDRWFPVVGWLELSISGAGATATLSLSVLHTRAETIGTYAAELGEPAPQVHHWLEVTETVISPGPPLIREYTPTQHATSTQEEGEVAGWTYLWFSRPGDLSVYQKRTGAILAVWYTPSGGYQRLTYDVEFARHTTASDVEWVCEGVDRVEGGTVVSRYEHSGSQAAEIYEHQRAALRLDGVVVDVFENEITYVYEHHYERDVGYWRLRNGAAVGTAPPYWAGVAGYGSAMEKLTDNKYLLLDQVIFWLGENMADQRMLCPYELSNHAWCLLENRSIGTAFEWRWRPTIAPGGTTDGAITTLPHSSGLRLYGSWCPVTHQLTRNTARVFWI